MSESRKFDNFIKNEFSEYTPNISADIWDKIVAERERRKPKGFWIRFVNSGAAFVLAGIVGVGAIGASYYYNTQNQISTPILASNQSEATSITSTITENTFNLNSTPIKGSAERISIASTTVKNSNIAKNSILIEGNGTNNTESTSRLLINDSEENTDVSGNELALDNNEANLLTRMDNSLIKNLLFSSSLNNSTIKKRVFPNVFIPDCPNIENEAAGDKRSIEVYAGPDFIFRSFTDTPQSEYLQRRKASTTIASAFSAGIRYSKVFKNGVTMKAGLNYSQINEKFSFIQNNLVQVTYIIDPVSGDTTGSYTITGTRKKVTNNRYRSIDIPLLLGYEIGNGKLHVNINAGAMVNIYSWQKGDVLDSTFQPVSITTGKTNSPYQFKNNVGVALTGGVSVFYKITDNLHIMAEPYFRYNLQSMNKESSSFKQKYQTMGIRAGLRLDLP